MPKLAAIAIGHGWIADKTLGRAEITGGTLNEQTGCHCVLLYQFTHGTDVVWADQAIIPRKCRRMARIVHENELRSLCIAGSNDDDRVIRVAFWIGPTDEDVSFHVAEVSLSGQIAATDADGDIHRRQILAGQLARFGTAISQRFEVGGDVFPPWKTGTLPIEIDRRVCVGEGDDQLMICAACRRAQGIEQGAHFVVAHPAQIQADDQMQVIGGIVRSDGYTRGHQWAVNALGTVVKGGAPTSVVGVGGRCDVNAANTELTSTKWGAQRRCDHGRTLMLYGAASVRRSS